jgi:hypothetical protein
MTNAATLAAAVIHQAIKDAQRGDREAQAWLRDQQGELAFWCDVAGFDVSYVSRMAAEVLTDYGRKWHAFDKTTAPGGGATLGAYHPGGGG